MSGHYCSQHKTPFFMRGKMDRYAHPINDAQGNIITGSNGKGLWCNEPEAPDADQVQHTEPTQYIAVEKSTEKPFEPAINQQKQASIESQNARTNLMNLVIAELGIPEEDRLIKDDIARALVSQLYSYTSLSFNGSYKEKGGHVVEAAKKAGAIEVDRTHGQFANVGAFLNRCHQEYGLQRPQVETLLGEPITAKTDLDGAWLTVVNAETK